MNRVRALRSFIPGTSFFCAFALILFLVPATQGAVIDTLAGGLAGSKPALETSLFYPLGLALDAAGNRYVSDHNGHRVFKVDAGGVATVLVGNGMTGSYGDGGHPSLAQLMNPYGLLVDDLGRVLIADAGNAVVRRWYSVAAAE